MGVQYLTLADSSRGRRRNAEPGTLGLDQDASFSKEAELAVSPVVVVASRCSSDISSPYE